MRIAAKSAITRRPAQSRGRTETGWLHSRHTFSFGEYVDPDQSGFRSLRVLNEDIVEPGGGFPTHAHRGAEIFSYVIEGELQHKDSLGHGSIITAGNLQYMSAGQGILHSEFNPSRDHRLHFLQIWLRPNQLGGAPRYAERKVTEMAPRNGVVLLASGDGRENTIAIRQDAELLFGCLDAGRSVSVPLGVSRGAWLQIIRGKLSCLGENLDAGDGAAIAGEEWFEIEAGQSAQFFLFLLS